MNNSKELKIISKCYDQLKITFRNNLNDVALFMRNEGIISKANFSEVTDTTIRSADDRAYILLRKWEDKVEEDPECYYKVVDNYFKKRPHHFKAVLQKINEEYEELTPARAMSDRDGVGASSAESRGASKQELSPPFSSGFSVKQLVEWLKLYHGLSDEACEILEKEDITGRVFNELTEDDMKQLGFNFGTRRTLLNVIKKIGVKPPEQVVKDHLKIGVTAITRTELDGHHYGKIIEQLIPVKDKWEAIAVELGFKPHEIADIASNPIRLRTNDYIYDVITRWLNWGPPDRRGSKDVATLEALQLALNNTINARIQLTL